MSINRTGLHPNGAPVFYAGEAFIRSQGGVTIELKSGRSSSPNYSTYTASGSLTLTNLRIIFISFPQMASFRCCEFPLTGITDHDYDQPIFSANEITGRVRVIPGSDLEDPLRYRLAFNEGGSYDFYEQMVDAIDRADRNSRPQRGQSQPDLLRSQSNPALPNASFPVPPGPHMHPGQFIQYGVGPNPGYPGPIAIQVPFAIQPGVPAQLPMNAQIPVQMYGQVSFPPPHGQHPYAIPPQQQMLYPRHAPPHAQSPGQSAANQISAEDPLKCAYIDPTDPFTIYIVDNPPMQSPPKPAQNNSAPSK